MCTEEVERLLTPNEALEKAINSEKDEKFRTIFSVLRNQNLAMVEIAKTVTDNCYKTDRIDKKIDAGTMIFNQHDALERERYAAEQATKEANAKTEARVGKVVGALWAIVLGAMSYGILDIISIHTELNDVKAKLMVHESHDPLHK